MSTLSLILLLLAVGLAIAAAASPVVRVRLLAGSVGAFELADLIERLGRG